MEFYLSQSYTYQSGQNDYRYVNLGLLPPSVQRTAFDALQNPGVPGNLVVLANLQSQYPSAFSQVSSLNTLPAPDLNLTPKLLGAFPLDIDALLNQYNQQVVDSSNEMSAQASKRAVDSSHTKMQLADKVKAEKDNAALMEMASQIVSGAVSVAAGATSVFGAAKGSLDCTANGKEMKASTTSKLETQGYKDTMERNVKELQTTAQNNRAEAQELKAYADQVDASPDGLSPASRQKIDDQITAKNDALKNIEDQRAIAEKEALRRSSDMTLTAEERAKAKLDFDGYSSAPRGAAASEFDAQIQRLRNSRDSLLEVKRMDAYKKRLTVDMKRLDELQAKPAPTVAEAREMLELQQNQIPRRTESFVKNRAGVQEQIDGLNSEATRLDAGAADLQKSAQDELASRNTVHQEQDTDLNMKMSKDDGFLRALTTASQAASQSGALFGSGFSVVGKQEENQAGFDSALTDFTGNTGDQAKNFADYMTRLRDAARDNWEKYTDGQNNVATNIAHNI